jgi:hypothetical protein
MIKFLRACCFAAFVCLSHAVSAAELPAKFVGKWSVELVAQPGFPWWHQIKYPVEIVIENDSGYFVDQAGNRCEVENYFYDEEEDVIVLMHCAETKSSNVVPPFYMISAKDGKLIGKVQSYKPLFQWLGSKTGN